MPRSFHCMHRGVSIIHNRWYTINMDEILHANIFFFIASAATIVFCMLVSIALYQVIKILKLLRSIMERIEAGSELIAEDVAHVRSFIKNGGLMSRVIGLIMGAGFGRRARSRKAEDDEV